MDIEEIIVLIHCYCIDFDCNKDEIINLLKSIKIDEYVGNSILYGFNNRSVRFRLFLLMLKNNSYLNNDRKLCFKLFKEAYIETDNIYSQIKKEDSHFDIVDFLKSLGDQNFYISLMRDDEKQFFDSLPEELTIYRGMCNQEKENGVFGISWTTDLERANKYVFYSRNNVECDLGWIAKAIIKKSDIITVIGVKDDKMEILIRPIIY